VKHSASTFLLANSRANGTSYDSRNVSELKGRSNIAWSSDGAGMNQETTTLLARLRGFLLPEGDAVARGLKTVRIFEKGEMRTSAEARWMSFTSEQTLQTQCSGFRWEARTSGVVITDAYEEGHGMAMSRLAGLLTLKKASSGPELDRARYSAISHP